MRRDALQRCFFSGKNGVWFRKKTSVKPPVSVSLDEAAAVVIDNAAPDVKKCPEALSSVIGWDEVRGRPIYHYSSSLERCELQHVTDDDSRQDLEGSDDEDAPPPLVDHSVLWNDRSRKRKVFGGDRRLRPLSGLLIDATVSRDEKEPPSSDNPNISSESYLDLKQFKRQSSPPTTSGAACGGNAEQQSSTFTVQASDHFRSSRRGLRCGESHTGVSERREDSNRQFEFDGDTKLPATSHKRIKQLSSTRRGRSAPSCDDQNSLHKSLDTARQFFEKLAAQSLTLDTSGTPRQLTKRPCSRTRRARRLSSPNLTAEYVRYAQVCRESGVSPLPKQEYTTNRGEYFRTNELYDGFLDE